MHRVSAWTQLDLLSQWASPGPCLRTGIFSIFSVRKGAVRAQQGSLMAWPDPGTGQCQDHT